MWYKFNFYLLFASECSRCDCFGHKLYSYWCNRFAYAGTCTLLIMFDTNLNWFAICRENAIALMWFDPVLSRNHQKALFNRPFSHKMPTHLKLNLLMKWQQIIDNFSMCRIPSGVSLFTSPTSSNWFGRL